MYVTLACIVQLTGCVIRLSLQLIGKDLRDIIEALWGARLKWLNIGLRLNMNSDDLEAIDKEGGTDTEGKFRRMVMSRLKMAEPCTWTDLYEALRHPTVGMAKLAEELKNEKLGASTSK